MNTIFFCLHFIIRKWSPKHWGHILHVLDYYFSKKNNYAFSNKNYKLEKLVIKKTLFYDDISTSTLRAMRAQTPPRNLMIWGMACKSYVQKNCSIQKFDFLENHENELCPSINLYPLLSKTVRNWFIWSFLQF